MFQQILQIPFLLAVRHTLYCMITGLFIRCVLPRIVFESFELTSPANNEAHLYSLHARPHSRNDMHCYYMKKILKVTFRKDLLVPPPPLRFILVVMNELSTTFFVL